MKTSSQRWGTKENAMKTQENCNKDLKKEKKITRVRKKTGSDGIVL